MADLTEADLTPAPREELAALRAENQRLRQIRDALITRVESASALPSGPYGAFEHSVTLAEQVRERTRALNQTLAQLQASEAALRETALAEKTRFLAAVGHDVLQPLNAARLFVESLTDLQQTEPGRRLADNTRESLEAVSELLATLVHVSRLDTGMVTPQPRAFALRELLDGIAREFQQIAADKGLSLRYVPSRAWVHSDPQLLGRVLRNLLANAVRYSEQGRILLGCRHQGQQLAIEVLDQGQGISADQQAVIFREFKQLRPQRGEGDYSLGLGLAIVERLLGLLQHPLQLTSQPGQGSRFSIVLPRADNRL